jgi:hypothetical protein
MIRNAARGRALLTPLNCDDIRRLAKELRRPIGTLIVLAPKNDPFYVGEARQDAATWFVVKVWDPLRPGPGAGVHLRRLHYVLVVRLHDRLSQT